MKTRYGVSPWIAGFPESKRPAFERFRGQATVDVAIIGGGLTGCAIAYSLAAAGVRAHLFEANRLGQGSAGRSGGLLLADPGLPFRDIQQKHGLRAARTIFEAWRRAALDAAALLRRGNIKCQLSPSDSLILAEAPGNERALRRDFDAREEAGVAAAWVQGPRIRQAIRRDASAAVRVGAGFTLDPYRACIGLAAAASRRRARLYERSPVTKVKAAARDVEITLEGGVVRATTVIIATGIATMEFKPLRRHFKPRETYLVLTEPVPAALRKQLFDEALTVLDVRMPPHRMRWTADHRLVVSGADQGEIPARGRDAVRVQRTGQLMYELLTMYPVISGLQPEFGWEAQYGATADGLPYAGPHRNYPHHLFALGGDTSLTGAFLSARLLTRRIQGGPQKGDEVFGWTR
jgi:glycine/D-amino acid oxidase-like deaminating enzyme